MGKEEGIAQTSSFEELKTLRSSSKGSITRIRNLIETNSNFSCTELECRLGIVDSYYKQAAYYQNQIERIQPTDGGHADLDELYILTKSRILSLINERKSPSHNDQSFSFPSVHTNLTLPTFDGKYIDYKNFINTFYNSVHNDSSVSVIEKFNRLRNCLRGDALSTVMDFKFKLLDNYSKALDRLKERYDNNTLIFLENVTVMFDLDRITKAVPQELRKVVDTLSALYSSLQSLGSHQQICDVFLIHLAMSKVDSDTMRKWDEHLYFTNLPSWVECCPLLDRRCQQLDAQGKRGIKGQATQSQLVQNVHKLQLKGHSFHVKKTSPVDVICNHCNKRGHQISTCQQFIVLPIAQRSDQVKQRNLCFNCLSKGHGHTQCASKYSCRFCKQRHHSLLHKLTDDDFNTSLPSTVSSTDTSAVVHTTTTMKTTVSKKSSIILATAVILIRDGSGGFQIGRALLDSCSQVNFISESLVSQLGLQKSRNFENVLGIGSSQLNVPFKTQATVQSRVTEFQLTLEFLISRKITGYHPDENISLNDLNIPETIDLADPEFHIPRSIDILLGAEAFFNLLAADQIQLGQNLPTLQNTQFGWIVSGRCVSQHPQSSCNLFCTTSDIELNKNIERFWQLEEVQTQRQLLSEEQQRCEQHFINTVAVQDNNQIVVKLPFKGDKSSPGNSHDIALRRFLSLERRLDKNEDIKAQYLQFMREYEGLGHMSLIEKTDLNRPHYFIPHHCVLKPSSESTKLRVVFDASCRTASQTSLNDILMVGPTIQPELLTSILRFRCHAYGLTADIKKMYRQVMIHPDDRNFQLILWRENKSQPIYNYRLNTVTYGTSSAPYLAIRSLHFAAERFPSLHKLGKSVITNDFYVDDMLTGADNLQTLQTIKREVSEILKYSKFELSKWHCSHPDMFSEANDSKQIPFDDDITSALGISWSPAADIFCFAFCPSKTFLSVTKRSILSLTSSLFDPVGLVSPLVIKAKILLQQLWIQGCEWDSPVPQEIEAAWNETLLDFEQLCKIKVPRCVKPKNTIELQVHGFCDASIRAYGCCIYFRCSDKNVNIVVRLLAAKSRVAPVKTRTLPRLELCAAHLLCKFWSKIRKHFEFQITQTFFWSDSQICLHWIHTHSSNLSTFVGNRVSDIQEQSSNVVWRHCPTKSNPADLVSRGCSINELLDSNWISGPLFLVADSSQWPTSRNINLSKEEEQLEKRKTVYICEEKKISYVLQKIHKISSYTKCLRVFAYTLRFRNPSSLHTIIISARELQIALHHIVFVIQRHHFLKEFLQLQKDEVLIGPLASLRAFLDNLDGVQLIRVGGRLENTDLPVSAKYPFLLPKDDPFVHHMTIYLHKSNFHVGPRALVALIQQQFWIVNCRNLARKIVNNCIHCMRYKPKLLTQIMGNLPKDRITVGRPFEVVGVDFAGPIPTYLKIRGKIPYKSYIAVFVCFKTKAAHLEAVSDLSLLMLSLQPLSASLVDVDCRQR